MPEYWNPHRVACFAAGPEDLVFSFAGGGLVFEPRADSAFAFRDMVVDLDRRGRIKRVQTHSADGDITTTDFSEWQRMKNVDGSLFEPPLADRQ